ncbi:MAG: DUF2088 domain-containing protein [Chloracidobacterium sp.]|nr:DUF2088 domain-containing protein [Chloracidobacterium sp.]
MAIAFDHQSNVFGSGSPEGDLTDDQLNSIARESLADVPIGARVLAIIPDKTRDDNTNILFPAAAAALATREGNIDALVAQGTHPAMSSAEKLAKIGADRGPIPNLGNIFDHRWNESNELTTIGELSADEVAKISGGLIAEAIPLRINHLLASGDYDLILVFGATMPHEVAGFAGGAKYFFPGVAGPELTHKTHWLAAMASVENIIGRVETPTRHLIEAAAEHINTPAISFTSVISRTADDRLRTHSLFVGNIKQALRQATDVSRHVHIKYTSRKYRRVVALLDKHYEDLWVGGKASYRIGGIIEDGGELLIFAPHLTRVSETHGRDIIRFGGYAPLEKVKNLVATSAELRDNLCVAAHLSQVAFAGRRNENGDLAMRYDITLASALDAETCGKLNLKFMDVADFQISNYQHDSDTLIVERAGRDLYLVAPTDS